MLIDADLSALEWRVGAELSRDEIMIKEIIEGVDIHTLNAIAIFGSDKYRQDAKVVSFRSLINIATSMGNHCRIIWLIRGNSLQDNPEPSESNSKDYSFPTDNISKTYKLKGDMLCEN